MIQKGHVHTGLQPYDMLCSFARALGERDPLTASRLRIRHGAVIAQAEEKGWVDPVGDLVDALRDYSDALQRTAPDGYFFGPKPGTAEFGFWPREGPDPKKDRRAAPEISAA